RGEALGRRRDAAAGGERGEEDEEDYEDEDRRPRGHALMLSVAAVEGKRRSADLPHAHREGAHLVGDAVPDPAHVERERLAFPRERRELLARARRDSEGATRLDPHPQRTR